MELIDICDENGKITGKTGTIDELHKFGRWHKVVGIIIYDSNKNILMQQRALSEKSDPGKWDIAAAGHINSGETSIEGIQRELFEEIGLKLQENQIKFFMSYKKEVKDRNVNKKHIEDIYIAKIDNINIEQFIIQKEEVEQIKLLSIHDIEELIRNKKIKTRGNMYNRLFKYLNKNSNFL